MCMCVKGIFGSLLFFLFFFYSEPTVEHIKWKRSLFYCKEIKCNKQLIITRLFILSISNGQQCENMLHLHKLLPLPWINACFHYWLLFFLIISKQYESINTVLPRNMNIYFPLVVTVGIFFYVIFIKTIWALKIYLNVFLMSEFCGFYQNVL